MGSAESPETVARFCAATQVLDIDAAMTALASDADLVCPVSARLVFCGHEDLRVLLRAVYRTIKHLHWQQICSGNDTSVWLVGGTVLGVRLTEVVVFDLGENGDIKRINIYSRPWLAHTFLAIALGPRLGRHPGLIRRAFANRDKGSSNFAGASSVLAGENRLARRP
jgi:hypothetical protein